MMDVFIAHGCFIPKRMCTNDSCLVLKSVVMISLQDVAAMTHTNAETACQNTSENAYALRRCFRVVRITFHARNSRRMRDTLQHNHEGLVMTMTHHHGNTMLPPWSII